MNTNNQKPSLPDVAMPEQLNALHEAANFAWAYGKDKLHATLRTMYEEAVARAAQPAKTGDVAMPEPFAYVTTDRKHIVFGDRIKHSEAVKSGMSPLYLPTQPAEGSAQVAISEQQDQPSVMPPRSAK